MRPLAVFLLGVAIVFGLLAAAIVLTRPNERVFVVVDTSFPMREVWEQVPRVLETIKDEGYAEVALATEKDLVHSWQERFRLRAVTPYAPCDFADVETYDEAAEADAKVLITTSASCATEALAGWEVRTLDP
ncbi:MAG: hypothetical protein AB1Z66_01070 [Candidatus Limnocylindrales bacterium]